MKKTMRRVIIGIPTILVLAFICWYAANVAGFLYLTASYNKVKPGMSHARVMGILRGFSEKRVPLTDYRGARQRSA